MPQYLQEVGYKTHAVMSSSLFLFLIRFPVEVGKWHLGYCHRDYLPHNRGFHSFFGQWSHVVNYYSRLTDNPHHPERAKEKVGYDLHQNGEITQEGEGEFMPDLISR